MNCDCIITNNLGFQLGNSTQHLSTLFYFLKKSLTLGVWLSRKMLNASLTILIWSLIQRWHTCSGLPYESMHCIQPSIKITWLWLDRWAMNFLTRLHSCGNDKIISLSPSSFFVKCIFLKSLKSSFKLIYFWFLLTVWFYK